MKILTLLDRFYSYSKDFDESSLSVALIQVLKERTSEYDIDFQYLGLHGEEKRPIIAISGADENIVSNLIRQQFGTIHDLDDIVVQTNNFDDSSDSIKSDIISNYLEEENALILRGRLRDPNSVNFGIFIDCGIEKPKKDVLYPVFEMRKQLVDDLKIPKRKIVKLFGFFEEMPVYIRITRVDKENNRIECRLARETVDEFKQYMEDGLDILFSSGVPRKQIKRAIKRKGHYPDYVTIDRMGFLETKTFLKRGTNAPGILAHIGPLLPGARFSMLRPRLYRKIIREFSS